MLHTSGSLVETIDAVVLDSERSGEAKATAADGRSLTQSFQLLQACRQHDRVARREDAFLHSL